MSQEAMNPIDHRRDGHGRQHQAQAQKIVKRANNVTTTRDAMFSEPVEGSSIASETTATRPVPRPISIFIASESDRLVKYCTCAA
jgi:hypothetical protein